MKITLNNVASYKRPVTIEADKDVNLFYGLNGTGKTILSNFLYYYQNDKPEEDQFQKCRLEDIDNKELLVYNQKFIQDNFLSQDDLKGIFTLSKENKEAEEAIEELNKAKKDWQTKLENKEQEKKGLEQSKQKELNNIQDVVWKIKTDYSGRGMVLDFCLDGFKKEKEKLFNHIKQIPRTETSKVVRQLQKEANEIIGEKAQRYKEIDSITLDVEAIENNSLFSEEIVGNEDSPLAELITELANQDWVEAGRKYLPSEPIRDKEQCPFCQEETITLSFVQNVRAYFDKNYEQKIQEIEQLRTQYKSQEQNFSIDAYRAHPSIQERGDTFENHFNKLKQSLRDNLSKIEDKLKQPNQKIELFSTQDELKNLNDIIAEVNQEAQAHNQNIDDKEKIKGKIKKEFWQIMRNQYDVPILQYDGRDKELGKELQELECEIKSINSEIEDREKKIRDQQEKTVNIDEPIQNINTTLKELGIVGFSIQKHGDNSYRIVREGSDEGRFSTLSEGEKMLISFLYFAEQCKGKARVDETATEADKIIVIDDPISSLSHAYIFNLSLWIKKDFFKKGYKQVLVLTHSLYFFSELKRHAKDIAREKKHELEEETCLFRLIKDNETRIEHMKKNEILNEYQSYWQVIKDYKKNKLSSNYFLLANCMRNILEHFFGFINKSKLSAELEKLGPEFKAFDRYMNRESHSDAENITDSKEIDPGMFMRAFKEVFVKSGYEAHYNEYMK